MTIPAPPPGVLTASDFSDGFHLNEDGARKYSGAFAQELNRRLRATMQAR
jgi:hypothetical protein